MAAGPGIRPRAAGAPWRAGRSAHNYPHLVAQRAGLDLIDVTYSGATTAHVLTDRQHGAPPQITALDGSEALITITIGGNDVGYVPLLMAASLPAMARPCRCSADASPNSGTVRRASGPWPRFSIRSAKSAARCDSAR
jgi:lysophospholipase L1-like esterase